MDATRARRTKDQVRQGWYAAQRQRRFARYLGFAMVTEICREETPVVTLPTSAPASFPPLTTARVA
jgi:hypothetical protein